MPQTRKLLGRTGVTFDHAYSPNPLCCPARAELVTGQYTHNNGVHSNSGAWGAMQALKEPDDNIGVWLQNAGYRTAYVGKYLNGYESWRDTHPSPAGWDRFDATIQWIYEYTRYQFESKGRPTVLDYTNTGLDDEGRPYITRAETEIMDGYVHDFSREGRPFFLFDSLLAPHGAQGDVGLELHRAIPEPKYADLYADKIPVNPGTRSAAFLDQHVSDVPPEARARTPVDQLATKTARAQGAFLQRIRALASVDDHVAAVVQQLRDAGQLDNTVFVFTSDNGFLIGEHRLLGKVLPYEESVRVPLIFSGPGLDTGATRIGLVSLADFAPTVLELAGATSPLVIDGESLLRRIHGLPVKRRSILFQAGPRSDPAKRFYTAIRTPSHVYVEYDTGETEFYDLRSDPFELNSINDSSVQPRVRQRLAAALATLRNCAGASCR
jgi:arylsulfatase A-like enzyme